MLIQARKYKLISLFIKKDNKPFYAHNFQETEQLKKNSSKNAGELRIIVLRRWKKGRDPSQHETLTKHANTQTEKTQEADTPMYNLKTTLN